MPGGLGRSCGFYPDLNENSRTYLDGKQGRGEEGEEGKEERERGREEGENWRWGGTSVFMYIGFF